MGNSFNLLFIFLLIFISGCNTDLFFKEKVVENNTDLLGDEIVDLNNNLSVNVIGQEFNNLEKVKFDNDVLFKFSFGEFDNLSVKLNGDLIFASDFSHIELFGFQELEEYGFGTFEIYSSELYEFGNVLEIDYKEVDDGTIVSVEVINKLGVDLEIISWRANFGEDIIEFPFDLVEIKGE